MAGAAVGGHSAGAGGVFPPERQLGVTTVGALLAGSAAGLAWAGIGFAATRKVNVITLLIVGGLLVGGVLTFVTGDAKFAVAKDSIYTGAFGLALLGSLLARRPLMFYLLRPFATQDNDPEKVAEWNGSWAASR